MQVHKLLSGIYGPLPGPLQSVPRAELFAVCIALLYSVGPVCIFMDHKNIVDQAEKGEAFTTSPGHANADLWRWFWHLVDDRGGLGPSLRLKWIKSHTNDRSAESVGNNWADAMAKLGAGLHEASDEVVAAAKEIRNKLTQILRWMGRAACIHQVPGFPPDRTPKLEWPVRTAEVRKALAAERQDKILKPSGGTCHEVPTSLKQHSQFQSSLDLRVTSRLTLEARQSRAKKAKLEDDRLEMIHSQVDMVEVEAQPQQTVDAEVVEAMPAKRPLEAANCAACGRYQTLVFQNGVKTRELCGCTARQKRRRLTYKQPDLLGAFNPMQQAAADTVDRQDAHGHVLMVVNSAALTWCIKCGSYTKIHIKYLGRTCDGTLGSGKLKVLNRLKGGRHPLTNEPIGASSRLMLS